MTGNPSPVLKYHAKYKNAARPGRSAEFFAALQGATPRQLLLMAAAAAVALSLGAIGLLLMLGLTNAGGESRAVENVDAAVHKAERKRRTAQALASVGAVAGAPCSEPLRKDALTTVRAWIVARGTTTQASLAQRLLSANGDLIRDEAALIEKLSELARNGIINPDEFPGLPLERPSGWVAMHWKTACKLNR